MARSKPLTPYAIAEQAGVSVRRHRTHANTIARSEQQYAAGIAEAQWDATRASLGLVNLPSTKKSPKTLVELCEEDRLRRASRVCSMDIRTDRQDTFVQSAKGQARRARKEAKALAEVLSHPPA